MHNSWHARLPVIANSYIVTLSFMHVQIIYVDMKVGIEDFKTKYKPEITELDFQTNSEKNAWNTCTFTVFTLCKKDKHLFTLWPKADKNGNTASVSTCLTWTSTYSLSKITKQPSKGSKLCIFEKFIQNTYSSCSCSCFIISATRLKIALLIMYKNHITPCSVTRMYITSSNTKHLKFPWKLTTNIFVLKYQ